MWLKWQKNVQILFFFLDAIKNKTNISAIFWQPFEKQVFPKPTDFYNLNKGLSDPYYNC